MDALRKDFPFLKKDPTLLFLDNAATTQKPYAVLEAVYDFYAYHYAPVHRATYQRAEQATMLYEQARATVARYINAETSEIVFTKNATEGINFIATSWGLSVLKPGDEIVLTELEHHANLIPWQEVARSTGALVRIIPVNEQGLLREDLLDEYITEKTRLVSFVDVSNALGTHTPKELIIKKARSVGALILLDACQSAPQHIVDVKTLGVDFLVFSGHKMLGPTGIGVLFIAQDIQPKVKPYQYGGGMLLEANYQTAHWLPAPHCYEAGTPPIAQAIGLAAAITYLNAIDRKLLQKHQALLCNQLIDGLKQIPSIKILGPEEQLRKEGHLVSFIHTNYHHHDVAAFLDQHGIAVRAGHYCAQPLAKKLNIDGSVRVSFYLYNTPAEVATLLAVLQKIA